MDFEIALMAGCFIAGAVTEHLRGRALVKEAIEIAETYMNETEAAMRFDRRAPTTEPPVRGQEQLPWV